MVAHRRRQSPARLYRRASFAWLCVEFAFSVTAERQRTLAHSAARLDERHHTAYLANLAFHDGPALSREFLRVREDRTPRDADAGFALLREAIAEADALHAAGTLRRDPEILELVS